MEGVIIVFLVLGFTALGSVLARKKNPATPKVVEMLRVQLPEGKWEESSSGLAGKVGDLAVQITKGIEEKINFLDEVRITDHSRTIPLNLRVTRETALSRIFRGEELCTGDEIFDHTVRIQGNWVELAAVLGADVRAHITRFQELGALQIKERNVTWRFFPEYVRDEESLVTGIRELVQLAQWLQLPAEEIPRRLEENARSDPVPAVRLECFRLLLQSHGDSEPARQASRALLDADLPRLRLWAARHIGAPDGIPVLQSLFDDVDTEEALRLDPIQA